MKKLQLTAIAALTAALFAGSAMADEYSYQGFYAGFGVGTAKAKAKVNAHVDVVDLRNSVNSLPNPAFGQIVSAYNASTSRSAKNGLSENFYIGYNINSWLAVEASYMNAQSQDLSGLSATESGSINTNAFTIAPKFTAHLGDIFAVYAKAGVAFVKSDISYGDSYYDPQSANLAVPTYHDAAYGLSGSNTGITYGAGIELTVTNNISVRLAYDAVQAKTKNASGSGYDYATDKQANPSLTNANLFTPKSSTVTTDYFSANVQYNF